MPHATITLYLNLKLKDVLSRKAQDVGKGLSPYIVSLLEEHVGEWRPSRPDVIERQHIAELMHEAIRKVGVSRVADAMAKAKLGARLSDIAEGDYPRAWDLLSELVGGDQG